MITFSCPSCSASYAVSEDKSGRRTTCRQCGRPLAVPEATGTDWELVPDGDNEPVPDTAQGGVGPACPQCGAGAFGCQPVPGPAPSRRPGGAAAAGQLYLVFCTGCGHIVTAAFSSAGVEGRLAEVRQAVVFLHDTVAKFVGAVADSAEVQQRAAALRAGLNGLNQFLSE